MGDVAQILGVSNSSRNEKKFLPPPSAPASHTIPKSIQNSSVILNNKPVLKVLSSGQTAPGASHNQKLVSTSLPPIVPSHNLPLQTTKRVINKDASNSTTTPTQNPSLATSQISFVKINNKAISTKKARSWVFAPFTNSARKDGLKLHHWVRAGVEYPEYPYARFNIHLEELSYRNEVLEIESANQNSNNNAMSIDGISSSGGGRSTAIQNRTEEEINAAADLFYEQHLQHKEWSQSETDTLLELCRVYQLRWPVIMDRWIGKFGSLSSKKVEDLQHRYYTIGYILNRMKVERAAKVEAENLAKAMAVANQSVSSMVGGVMGGVGGVVGGSTSLDDVKENETLKAKHMLSTAIATSSSNAINSLIGEVKSNLQPPVSVPHTGTSNQPTFDLEAERQRRQVLDAIWARTKEEELEEIELRNELKLVEAQIRKMKKSGGHLLAAAAAASASGNPNNGISGVGGTSGILSASSSVADSKPSSRGQSPVPTNNVDHSNNTNNTSSSTTNASSLENSNILTAHFAPTPTPGTPYLQSGRQKQPTTNNKMGINKTTLKRMDQVLQELKVKESPLPTKRVCDLYDHVRRDTLILLSLQKIMLKKENEVISRRMRLEKMSNTIVQQQREAAAAAAAKAAAEAAAAAKAAEAAANAKNNAKGSGKNNSGGNNTTSGANNNSGGSTSGNNKSSSGGKDSTKAGSSSTTTTGKKGSSSSKKGSSKNSSSGGKGSTKEKKTKKKSEGTKKRKSSSKKKDSDASKKAASSAASGAAAASNASSANATSSGKSTIISNNAGGTGVVVGTATSASNATTSVGAGSSKATTSKSSKKNTDSSTLDADGKPAKKRAKKSSTSNSTS